MRLLLLAPLACAAVLAGPVEFGMEEVGRAITARGLKPAAFRFRTEIGAEPIETFRIEPGRISGGDLRGLMYGLLEAAEQIRLTGRLRAVRGAPAVPIRGIRCFLHNQDLEKDWYYSREYWLEYLRMLARNRFNRFNLVFAHQTDYLAPPYPYWVEVEEYPGIRVPGLSHAARQRNLEMLRFISQTAQEHGIDFTLGVWQHNIQPRMKPSVQGLTRENIGPYSYAALKKVLAACPAIRSVQMRTNSESGIPADQQVEFYRDWVYRAIGEAGRRVTLDLRGWIMRPGMMEAATGAGIPLRLSSKYWGEHLGGPYQPAETWPNYSFINFLEKPRPYEFYWELWGLGSHRLLLWGDPDYVRRAAGTFTLGGSSGFEIDPPLAQKGFGNRPGKWGVFTEAAKDRVFWRHEFERYWMFYRLWGRLTYDPKTSERVWMAELERRFGSAARDVMEAYRAASGVLHEIVRVHLADPNMYVWPEINPGGLIDAYRVVPPSDWRMVAGFDEAVRNRLKGVASAKQTALSTSSRLHELALRVEQALKRAKVDPANKEWRSSEMDFQVLAALARYHGRKQLAADQLTWFYQTGDGAALAAARRELAAGLKVWEGLVKLTSGVFPDEMAFGPDDAGHWKHKLPYVRHDLEIAADRQRIFEQFGRFDYGFDFGGPVAPPKPVSYRADAYIVGNTVEPRFQPVAPETRLVEGSEYGWVGEGKREARPIPPTPYLEARAVAHEPKNLPRDVLYRDFIEGEGRQIFRLRAPAGPYTAVYLHPDRTTSTRRLAATGGYLDVPTPEGAWKLSGLVIQAAGARRDPVVQRWPKPVARPTIVHAPPKTAAPGRPLTLTLKVWPINTLSGVRLHYRPLNQLAQFRTLEAPPGRASFTIPAAEVDARWDLMYYFEVLNKEGAGWFDPDPDKATPYYIAVVEKGQ